MYRSRLPRSRFAVPLPSGAFRAAGEHLLKTPLVASGLASSMPNECQVVNGPPVTGRAVPTHPLYLERW
jgi:hypothetical protein